VQWTGRKDGSECEFPPEGMDHRSLGSPSIPQVLHVQWRLALLAQSARTSGVLSLAPHAADSWAAGGRLELSDLRETQPFVTVVVRPVARLEVGGHTQFIYPRQVRG
jgi:hypothetical protein